MDKQHPTQIAHMALLPFYTLEDYMSHLPLLLAPTTSLSFLPPQRLTFVTILSLFCQQGADSLHARFGRCSAVWVLQVERDSEETDSDSGWCCMSDMVGGLLCPFGLKKVLPLLDVAVIIKLGDMHFIPGATHCTSFPYQQIQCSSAGLSYGEIFSEKHCHGTHGLFQKPFYFFRFFHSDCKCILAVYKPPNYFLKIKKISKWS